MQHASDISSMSDSSLAEPGARLAPHEIRRIVYGLMMAMMLGALDQTIVATALPTIGRDLGGATHLPWVVTAYLLAATSAVPIYGKISDIHGRRVVLLAAIAIFALGSILCALAPTMGALIAARFAQGIGGGGLLALSQTIVGDMLTPRERAGWQVYFATAFTTASLAGPVLGGFFAEHLTWQMIFWINVPLAVAAYVMTAEPLKRLPRHERRHRLDVVGAILLVASTSTLLVTLSWAGARFGWVDLRSLAMLVVSASLFGAFYRHLRRTDEPLIPLDVLSNKIVLFAIAAATFSVGLFLGLAIYVPILFETLRGLTASQSGVALLPLTVGTVAGTLMSGRAMATRVHYKRLPLAAMPCAAAAALVLAAFAGTMPVWGVSLVLAVISIALGTLLPISTVSIQNAVELHQLGTATATANLCRQLGGAVAVAIFGAVLLGTHAQGAIDASMQGRTELLASFRVVFALVALGAVAAFATMYLMEERPLDGPTRADGPRLAAGE